MLGNISKIKYNAIVLSVIFFSCFDLLLKKFAYLHKGFELKIITGLLFFNFEPNYNIAFSINIINSEILPYIIFFLIILLIYLFVWLIKNGKFYESLLILIIIFGSANNLFDRVKYGFVVDYLYLNRMFIFNLSDVLIVLGSAGLVWLYFKR
jgi:lipoprotein signal peptidase